MFFACVVDNVFQDNGKLPKILGIGVVIFGSGIAGLAFAAQAAKKTSRIRVSGTGVISENKYDAPKDADALLGGGMNDSETFGGSASAADVRCFAFRFVVVPLFPFVLILLLGYRESYRDF